MSLTNKWLKEIERMAHSDGLSPSTSAELIAEVKRLRKERDALKARVERLVSEAIAAAGECDCDCLQCTMCDG